MILLAVFTLLASPNDQLGFGSAAAGMGGAVLADPPGAAAAFHNPAYAAHAEDFVLSLGYSATDATLRLNGAAHDIDVARAATLGVLVPTRLGEYGAVGAAFNLSIPDERILRARILPTDRPRFFMYDNRLQRVSVDFSLAYARTFGAVEAGLSAGLSFLGGAAGSGTTFFLRQNGSYQRADASVDSTLPLISTPLVSAFARYGDWRFGAMLRGALQFELALGTIADVQIVGLDGDVFSAVVSDDFYTPMKAALAAGRQLGAWTLQAALELHRWSAAPALTPTAIVDAEFVGIEPEVPQGVAYFQRFKDVWIPRLGAERRWVLDAGSVAARGGVFYEPTPLPNGSAGVFLDADRVGAALGAGFETSGAWGVLPQPIALDAHVLVLQLIDRRLAAPPVASARPRLDVGGVVLSGGVTLTLRF